MSGNQNVENADERFPHYKLHNDVFNSEGTFDTGASFTLAVGKSWSRYFRTELEYGYRRANFSGVNGTLESYQLQEYEGDDSTEKMAERDAENAYILQEGGTITPFEESAIGDMSAHSLMANAFLDLSNKTRLTPYLGGGIGVAFWKYDYVIDDFNTPIVESSYGYVNSSDQLTIRTDEQPVGYLSGEEDGVDFAYQLLAGVAFDFTDNIKGTAGYRLFGIDNDHDYLVHSAEMGIRYSF